MAEPIIVPFGPEGGSPRAQGPKLGTRTIVIL